MNMKLTLYFLRHGQTAFSRDNAFCGSGLNPELTDDGQAMAQAFALAQAAKPWRAIYGSPLRRAMETAAPLCAATGLTMQSREGLQEIAYGSWEGLDVETVSRDFHDDYLRWTADPAWNAPTGGETAIAIARRGLQVVEEIRRDFDSGSVLIVSHKATIRIILCALLGIDVGRFRFRLGCPVGSVSAIEFTDHGPLLHTLADRSHLDERLRSLPGT
jgi:broad specificity phosphatase PhoE